jgi:hypothetical protein
LIEKVFPESQVCLIIEKAIIEGKIALTQNYINFNSTEINEKEEAFEFISEYYYRSEQWIECNSALLILHKLIKEFEEVLEALEKRNLEI